MLIFRDIPAYNVDEPPAQLLNWRLLLQAKRLRLQCTLYGLVCVAVPGSVSCIIIVLVAEDRLVALLPVLTSLRQETDAFKRHVVRSSVGVPLMGYSSVLPANIPAPKLAFMDIQWASECRPL